MQTPETSILRFGTLGASRIAPAAIIDPAQKNPRAELVAVAARDRKRAEKFARKYQIPHVYDTYDDLLTAPDIDAVYNPLPNSLHAQWTIRALKAGKHVLCEKPMSANAAEARDMAETADSENRYLMEAFHWLYHDMGQRILETVRTGKLGKIKHIAASFCIPYLKPGDIRYRFDLAGGATMDLGAYTVSMLRHVSGEEPQVISSESALSSPGVDRMMVADFQFPSGATGSMQVSMFSSKLFAIYLQVNGTKGYLYATNPVMPHRGLWAGS